MIDLTCARCSNLVRGHAYERPEGWVCAACANASSGKNTGLIALGVGCAAIGGFLVLIMVFLAIWQFLSPGAPAPTPVVAPVADAGPSDALTERYEMSNGLVIAHYPASFAASKQGADGLSVARPVSGGNSEAVVFEAVPNPISNDLKENNRLLGAAEAKLFDRYAEVSNGPATCNGRAGIAVVASFVANGITYERRACRFLEGGRLYSFAYVLPQGSPEADRALLEKIVGAAELRP